MYMQQSIEAPLCAVLAALPAFHCTIHGGLLFTRSMERTLRMAWPVCADAEEGEATGEMRPDQKAGLERLASLLKGTAPAALIASPNESPRGGTGPLNPWQAFGEVGPRHTELLGVVTFVACTAPGSTCACCGLFTVSHRPWGHWPTAMVGLAFMGLC